ncbi:MAG: sulfotransferase domain-containing protein, partial [Fuerstiella sp.]|nr:sulfotransferase domain-containing protein [Fuerstiella sp.]
PDICCHFQRPVFPIVEPLRGQLLFGNSPVVFSRKDSPYGGVFNDETSEQKYVHLRSYLFHMDLLAAGYLDSIRPSAPDDVMEYVERIHGECVRGLIASALRHDTSKAIVGTKVFTDLQQLFRFYPDAKVIHILRDGRDVAVSKRFHYLRQGAYYQGDERWMWVRLLNRTRPGAYLSRLISDRTRLIPEAAYLKPGDDGPLLSSAAIRKLATEWRNIVTYIRKFSLTRPRQFLNIRYEDMKLNPRHEIGRALAFLNADSNQRVVSEIAERTSFAKQDAGGFFRKGTSGDWVNHFTADNRHEFHSIAGQLLIELGYEESDDWMDRDPRPSG